jgi:hypothetical protein
MLAKSLNRLLQSAVTPSSGLGIRPSVARLDRVRAARNEMQTLIGGLLAPVPVSARGVALVQLLLCDGSGPMYRPGSRADLGALLAQAARALEPSENWPM